MPAFGTIEKDIGSAIPEGQGGSQGAPVDSGAAPADEQLSGGSLANVDVGTTIPSAGEALDELHRKALEDAEKQDSSQGVDDGQSSRGEGGKSNSGTSPVKPESDPAAGNAGTDGKGETGDGGEGGTAESGEAGEAGDVDSLTFPENSSSKAREQFEKLKTISRERVQAAESAAKEAAESLKALQDKLGGKSPEDVQKALESAEKELAELREFKTHVDIENAPEFAAFDKRVDRSTSTILKKLEEWGMTSENIEKIKTTGVTKIAWEAIFEHMTPQQKRFVESRLLDIENAGVEKEEAVSAAKENSEKFLKERSAQQEKEARSAENIRRKTAEELESTARWLSDPELPKDATKEQKADHEGSVKFLAAIREKLRVSLDDTSPEMHATLAYGNAMALYLRANVDYLNRQLEAAQKQAAEATEQLDKIRKAGRGKRPNQPTLEGGSRQQRKADPHQPGLTAEESLDKLYAEAQANDQNA